MRRFVLKLLIFSFFLSPVLLAALALEKAPAVNLNPAPSALDAARTKAALTKLKFVLDPDLVGDRYSISQAEMNSVLAVAARGLPFLNGRASVSSDDVSLVLSAQVPNPLAEAWVNVTISIAPSADRFRLKTFRIGSLELPPNFVLSALRYTIIAALGDDLVGISVEGVREIVIRDQTVSVGIALSPDERQLLLARTKQLFYTFSLLTDTKIVRHYYSAIDKAVYDRVLPTSGTFFPYLHFALNLANERADNGDSVQEVRSAILALGIYCGHWRTQYLVGEVITGDLKSRRSQCHNVTLAGRGDLRQHFIISAALETASRSGLAYPIGEFKELLDSNSGGSGFSFEDLAADRAGINFAAQLLESALVKEERETLIDRLTSEAAIFPNLSGLPESVSAADFERDYKTVESGKFTAVLVKIDQRIKDLPFYADQQNSFIPEYSK